ncbi:MAG: hypothetical protein M3Y24_01550 [Acidobacteriota bacterium]|nr:hypothetical protein [Acidobacteriota bacterium]
MTETTDAEWQSLLSAGTGLSSRFRNLFLTYLRKAFEAGKLGFYGEMASMSKPATFDALCRRMRRIKWVAFATPPLAARSKC